MKKLLLLACIVSVLTSCKTEYLTHALFQNDVQYMHKPMSTDSVKHGTYASGLFLVQSGDESGRAYGTAGLANIYQSYTFAEPNINLSYGVLGFAGNYQRSSQSSNNLSFNKAFQGLGANLSLSGYIPHGNVDWRVLGVDLVYTKEFGDYARFRKSGISTDDFTYNTKTDLFTVGLFTEVAIKTSRDVNLVFKVGAYNSPGQPHEVDNFFINHVNFNAAVGYKQVIFTGSMRLMPTEYFLLPSGLQLGAGYRF